MKNWQIENGTLLLMLTDGSLYHPKSAELYEQKDDDSFVHAEICYAPLSETNLRFSGLTAHVNPMFSFGETLKLKLCFRRNGSQYFVSTYDKLFNDYIIYEGTWKYIDPIVESINTILVLNNINPEDITYQQYIVLLKELGRIGIEVADDVVETVNNIKESVELEKPNGLNAQLYPYQSGGAKWLDFMVRQKCGSILGDEMGLGKTLQIIAIMGLLKERKQDSRFLVVCPVSLLENWRREISHFYPSLTTNIHYGSHRTGDYRELYKYDVNIMSYSCAVTDAGLLTMTRWDLLVIDEAQNIKNPKAKRTKAIKQIACDVPIAVTGTPFENHMTDVWSLVDFIMPGFLGNLYQFEQTFTDDVDSAIALEKLITPLLLRRRVKDVAKDLPERVDIPQSIIMSDEEACLYEDSRLAEVPHEELKSMQLAKIQKLRTFCTHPCVYDANYLDEDPTSISTKYTRLCEILEEIFASNEKVVIFTSFRRMIEMMCKDIKRRFNVYTNFIDGSVEATGRQKTIDEFTAFEGPGALILNPKAAGAGLNITCANHAIHYNLEWNPAVEDQASARVYRRGQNKTVFVYRLYYADTIEEIINEKIQSKRLLSNNAIIGNNGAVTEQEYLIKALSASPYKKQ
jgi:SNF2 family DNA or RNA helicase